jgi:hypothetical protein
VIVLDLLFELAVWHGYAKLRLHTEVTLGLFETATKSLGVALRQFQGRTCTAFATVELPQEEAARGRRTAALAAKGKSRTLNGKAKARCKAKMFNLSTYKLHALGDYPATISRYGPTDNYTTQVVSPALQCFRLV